MPVTLFEGYTNPSEINRTADIRGNDCLYMAAPGASFQIAMDCFCQCLTPEGYRHIPIGNDEINTYSVLAIPQWIASLPYPTYLALTPSTVLLIRIRGDISRNSAFGYPSQPTIRAENMFLEANEPLLIAEENFYRKDLRVVNYSENLLWIGYTNQIIPGLGYPLASGQVYYSPKNFGGEIWAIADAPSNFYVEEFT